MSTETARSAAEQQQLDAALVELFEHKISFNRVLGLKVESARAGDVRVRLAMRPELVGHHGHGRLHGGVVAAVLDALGGLALMAGIAERHPAENTLQVMHRFSRLGTIDLRVDFLRQGLGQDFVATAEVTRLGGRIGSTQMRLVNDAGTLIATGAAAYIL
ncbi:MAG: thioesterase family protein, partial [Burkholderiales bacterium]|nr:thioesterase family protein [Burkholderiales bacterium]